METLYGLYSWFWPNAEKVTGHDDNVHGDNVHGDNVHDDNVNDDNVNETPETDVSGTLTYCELCRTRGFTNGLAEQDILKFRKKYGNTKVYKTSLYHCTKCDFCHDASLKTCEECGYCRSTFTNSGKCNGHHCQVCNVSSKPGFPYIHCRKCDRCHLEGTSKCIDCDSCCYKLRAVRTKCTGCRAGGILYSKRIKDQGKLCGNCIVDRRLQHLHKCGSPMILTKRDK